MYENLCFFGSCDFNFIFFAIFLKMRQTILTLPVILSFMNFFVAQTSVNNFFSSIVEKFNISAIYKSIILTFQWIFLWYLSTSFVRKKSNSTTRRSSRTTSRWISTKNVEIRILCGLNFFVYQLNPGKIQYHIILFDSSALLGLRVPYSILFRNLKVLI